MKKVTHRSYDTYIAAICGAQNIHPAYLTTENLLVTCEQCKVINTSIHMVMDLDAADRHYIEHVQSASLEELFEMQSATYNRLFEHYDNLEEEDCERCRTNLKRAIQVGNIIRLAIATAIDVAFQQTLADYQNII